jgi:tetratricopeptide (TPR) repeat protein
LNLHNRFFYVLLAFCSVTVLPEAVRAQGFGGSPTYDPINGVANPLASSPQTNDFKNILPANMPGSKPDTIIGDKEPEAGWDGLARLLEAIAPSVDTRVPLTPTESTRRIEALLQRGRTQEALVEVDQLVAQDAKRSSPGTDVQLMFMHARVLTEVNRSNEAEAIYQKMTMRFPELPEPWNNLAVIYVKRGELEQARRALEMAIMINPKYAFALSNLGDVELSIALRSYKTAAAAGAPGIREKIRGLQALIQANAEAAEIAEEAAKPKPRAPSISSSKPKAESK